MRIRYFRREDWPMLFDMKREAALVDGTEIPDAAAFEAWLTRPDASIFVMNDEDEEASSWGQAETLDGLEGDIVGYTSVHLRRDQQGYHLLCQGTVDPRYRRQHIGRGLLIGALNAARHLAAEFEFEAEQRGEPVFFEALFPISDPAVPYLAERCELLPTTDQAPVGMKLYRREL